MIKSSEYFEVHMDPEFNQISNEVTQNINLYYLCEGGFLMVSQLLICHFFTTIIPLYLPYEIT